MPDYRVQEKIQLEHTLFLVYATKFLTVSLKGQKATYRLQCLTLGKTSICGPYQRRTVRTFERVPGSRFS